MPASFLTIQERDNYNHIPKLDEEQLLKGFWGQRHILGERTTNCL